jgi:hypothetical protein
MKNITPKATPVVISHTTPRKRTTKEKLAPAECRTIKPLTADKIELDFVARVELLDNGCWLWHGTNQEQTNNGRKIIPTFFLKVANKYKIVIAYRYAYEKRIGKLPNPTYHALRRTCGDLALCVNPNHYELYNRGEYIQETATPVMRENQRNATTCQRGLHPKTPENTIYQKPSNTPTCLPCRQASWLRRKAKAKAKATE